jgi:hypothetical protein
MAQNPDSRVLSVETGGRMLGLGRTAAYQAARRGDLPTIRIGRRLVVPRARLAEILGERVEDLDGDAS